MDARAMKGQKVVVIGAGPVGALAALYAAMRGSEVEVYELRGDLRHSSTAPLNFTKSINLALSERGVNALRHANCPSLLESVHDDTIPMYGRMIHGTKNGKLYELPQVYDVYHRALGAVDRGGLNKRLLDVLETMPNVKLFFSHKLTGADFNKNLAWIERREPSSPPSREKSKSGSAKRAPEIQISFDFMIGADGAHSAVRYHLMKFARLSYQQEYIDTLWCEFLIPPTADGKFQLSPNHLHIWPGKDNMFIAIPSVDKTFTSTLFMPASEFSRLDQNPDSLLNFLKGKFPGVVPDLISEKDIRKQYLDNPHLPLISIKCTPYHYKSSVVVIGDAAHAMVPFYGQGMNAGFEDVRILFSFLDQNHQAGKSNEPEAETITGNRAKAMSAYTTYRTPDAAAIIDLALRNYQEMRSDVQSPFYRLRKWTEETLAYYVPSLGWATQYSRISFGNDRYSEVIETSRRQLRILQSGLAVSVMAGLGIGVLVLGKYSLLKNVAKLFVRPLQYVEYTRYWLRRGGSSV